MQEKEKINLKNELQINNKELIEFQISYDNLAKLTQIYKNNIFELKSQKNYSLKKSLNKNNESSIHYKYFNYL